MQRLQKIIFFLFAALLFFVPIVLWPYNSEVFEFNKIILVYILTTLIFGTWVARCILERKIIFRRTILDVPLIIFIGSQLISTVLSIDPLTSLLGYYSRFNGGLMSIICYALLYWAFVTNFSQKDVVKLIKVILSSAALVSLYGVLEHLGIDKDVWVQDVQSRIFSTLGQPNWLAAWLAALMPITWVLTLNSKRKSAAFWTYFSLSVLFFWVLIFTKSRSGILGFIVAFVVFWGFYFWTNRKEYKKSLGTFATLGFSLIIVSLISGTQFTPSIYQLVSNSSNKEVAQPKGPALETGGTESGTIRKIVWKGALQVWQNYPIFGAGVETFAYSYYGSRPPEHNLVSEWDFIYNKAHNEFLNMAANSGTLGLLSYLFLIGASIYLFVKKIKDPEDGIWNMALLGGYLSLSATNFFGFSVVPTQLEFFLFPAIAIAMATSNVSYPQDKKLEISQKIWLLFVLFITANILFAIGKYWYADTLFAKGKAYNGGGKPNEAVKYLTSAVMLEPKQALYRNELANSLTDTALLFSQNKDSENTSKFVDMAISESNNAITLSPANLNLKRARVGIFIRLSTIDPKYLAEVQKTLIEAIGAAPTDAKLYYNLGLTYARMGQLDMAIEVLQKAIELKANYKEARLAYAILLIDKNDRVEARKQLEYILEHIDPNDSLAKQTLESVK